MKVLTLLLVPEIMARPFCSARFGSTVSQLGRVVSVEVRLVATEKMLRCIEVRGCKPTLLAMATREDREFWVYRSDRDVSCCSWLAVRTPDDVAAAKGEMESQVGVVRYVCCFLRHRCSTNKRRRSTNQATMHVIGEVRFAAGVAL